MARRGSSPKNSRGPGPWASSCHLHVITNTMSVIKKKQETFKNLGPSHKLGVRAGPPGPSVEPRRHMATE